MRVPLVDGDILRYEIGFAAEAGWHHLTNDQYAIPRFDFVEMILLKRLGTIYEEVDGERPEIFLTEGHNFRDEIAVTKPYKGQRTGAKPWHFSNLTVYMKDVLGAKSVEGIEADDAMTLRHLEDPEEPTIICSRDKDLKQVPGWFYSWELGNQPSFGPEEIDKWGSIELDRDRSQTVIKGTGLAFFYSQCLTGDVVDNIPGLPKCGPVKAFNVLGAEKPERYLKVVQDEYKDVYGKDADKHLLEQGRLLWMTRKLDANGKPVLWEIGMEE